MSPTLVREGVALCFIASLAVVRKRQLAQRVKTPSIKNDRCSMSPGAGIKRAAKDVGTISMRFVANPAHLNQVREQLGYIPTNMIKISAWSTSGKPTVIKLYPLRNAEHDRKLKTRATAEPFPTMYWLVDTELKSKISTLEDQGWINIIQNRLQEPHNLQKIKHQHQQYAEKRWSLLSHLDVQLVKKNKWERALKDVGIAGHSTTSAMSMWYCLHVCICRHP